MKLLVEVVIELKKTKKQILWEKQDWQHVVWCPVAAILEKTNYRSCHWCHLDYESQQSCYNKLTPLLTINRKKNYQKLFMKFYNNNSNNYYY